MKIWCQAAGICRYELRILKGNYKLYLIPVCLFIFMMNELYPIREFLFVTEESASPFLLPFLLNDTMLTASVFAGAVLFFMDAPFYEKQQLFVIMRSGVPGWILGQVLYIFAVSAIYMCTLVGISILMLVPKVGLSLEWGRVWTTLSLTDAGDMFGLTFGVSDLILFGYVPLEAMLLVVLLGFFICSFYGFCLWCLNMYVGRVVSTVITFASILLVTRVKYFPGWVMYLVPSAWIDLSNLSKYALHGISVQRAFFLLIAGCGILAAIAFYKTVRSDIAK